MKITSLKVKGFRGFNEEREIPFAPGLNLVYAPNGWGKSSLAEAIEWAVFGDTQRTIDSKSKTEFEGSYRNVHFDPSDTACVVMVCEKEHQEVRFLGEMDFAEAVTFTVTPESYSLQDTRLVRPIVYQHGLQRFIHTEPKNRWDEFANILGLSELERLHEILIKVKNNKEDAIPEESKQFINQLSQIRNTINSYDQVKDLKKPSEQNADVLISGATKIGEKIVEIEGGSKDDLINKLAEILEDRQKALFDVSAFSLKALDESLKQSYKDDRKNIKTFKTTALGTIKEYRGKKDDAFDSRKVTFIRSGLELLPHDSMVCPFCGEQTITDELRQKLNKEVQASSKTGELRKEIVQALSRVRANIENISNYFIPQMQSAPDIQNKLPKIRELLGKDASDFVDLLEQTIKQIINESAELSALKKTAFNAVNSIEAHIDVTEFNETFIKSQIANIDLLINKTDMIENNLPSYESFYDSAKERLQKKMSKREDIAVPELIIEILKSFEEIKQAFLVEAYIGQLDKLRRKVEEFHKRKTAEKLQEKRDDIQKWYEILNPKEDIGFTGIREHRSRKRWLEILAQSYGEEMSGPACLSESHLNAVGISVYLGQILGTESPFRFVVIDDPVQSMDEKHSRRFADVVKEILDEGYQVILLSHQNDIIEILRNTFQDSLDFGDFEITRYDKLGPNIQERIPLFQDYLEQAKKFGTGDATCRGASFNFLRKATERLAKEVYMKGKQVSLPKRYEKLDAAKMERLLVDSTIAEYREITSMRETLKFSGPPSHDDMSGNPPTPEELERHISRLEMYWKRWCQDS